MSGLCRTSLLRICSIINESTWKFASPLKPLFKRRIVQNVPACYYCKSFGLYDEEDDTLPEFNRRGAYIEKQRSSWRPRNSSSHYDDDEYGDDEDYPPRRTQYGNNMNRFDQRGRNEGYGQQRQPFNRRYAPDSWNKPYGRPSGNSFQPERYDRTSRYEGISSGYDNWTDSKEFPKQNFTDLSPIKKNLYSEHPDVAARSEEEIEEFRRTHGMTIRGTDVPKPITSFSELDISEPLLQVIKGQNFANPTPIQSQGWPIALSGHDMIGISQTGSGKTLVFILPAAVHILNQQPPQRSLPYACSPQALVLAPTRELVQQIHGVSSMFHHSCGIRSSCAYGGASKPVQLQRMQDAHICIATPGRLIDFIMEGSVSMKSCTYLVLDEADRMLDMGFEPQIRKIIDQIRPDRQTLMWSATWPKEVQSLAEDFLNDYVHVTVGSDELTANPNIKQNIYIMSEFDKKNRLLHLLNTIKDEGDSKILIFAQTKRSVDYLAENLNRKGIFAMAIHGDVSQSRRDRVIGRFRNDKKAILIATDVAARGLDVYDIGHVVNFDFPPTIEDYIHRIGRTARGTNTGVAHSFFTPENGGLAKDLINVLEEAGQTVNPDLVSFVGKRQNYKPRFSYYQRNNFEGRRYSY